MAWTIGPTQPRNGGWAVPRRMPAFRLRSRALTVVSSLRESPPRTPDAPQAARWGVAIGSIGFFVLYEVGRRSPLEPPCICPTVPADSQRPPLHCCSPRPQDLPQLILQTQYGNWRGWCAAAATGTRAAAAISPRGRLCPPHPCLSFDPRLRPPPFAPSPCPCAAPDRRLTPTQDGRGGGVRPHQEEGARGVEGPE